MDYTKLPRQLLYRTRKSLEEFTINNKMNEYLVDNMLEIYYLQSSNFKERATACFNAAYYICTLIEVDEHPEWSLPKYFDIALCGQKDNKVGQAISLSLVRVYMLHFGSKWNNKHKKLVDKLDVFLSNHWIQFGDPFLNDYTYKDAFQQLNSYDVATSPFPPTEFALRIIDQEAIEEMQIAHFTWTQFTDYYKYDIMQDIVFHVGKSEDEMTLLVNSLRYDAERFYSQDNPYYESVCNRLLEIEQNIYLHYHIADDQALIDSEIEDSRNQGDLKPLLARIAELEAQLNAQEQNVSDKREQKLTEDNQLEKEQDQEIIRLKNDLEAFKTQNGKNRMTASQAAIFLLTVCHNLGKLPNDKKKLTPILERVWNFTETTASRALGSKPSQDVADKTASIFESVSPKLARLIKEFPQTFEAIRLSKLKANNDKKLNNTKEEPK